MKRKLIIGQKRLAIAIHALRAMGIDAAMIDTDPVSGDVIAEIDVDGFDDSVGPLVLLTEIIPGQNCVTAAFSIVPVSDLFRAAFPTSDPVGFGEI